MTKLKNMLKFLKQLCKAYNVIIISKRETMTQYLEIQTFLDGMKISEGYINDRLFIVLECNK